MKKAVVVFLAAAMAMAGFIAAPLSHSQEKEAPEIKTINGDIMSADWEKSVITVTWLEKTGELAVMEKTIHVPPAAKIFKEGDAVGLMDVEPGDHVTVEYYDSPQAAEVKSIVVKN